MDSSTVAWVVMAVVAAIVEVSIPHFGLIFVSAGAFTAALVSWAGFGLNVQLLVGLRLITFGRKTMKVHKWVGYALVVFAVVHGLLGATLGFGLSILS